MELFNLLIDLGFQQSTYPLAVNRALASRVKIRCSDDYIQVETLQDANSLRRFPRWRICDIAVERDDMALLQAAHKLGLPCGGALNRAVKLGRYDLFLFLVSAYRDLNVDYSDLHRQAAKHGHLHIASFFAGRESTNRITTATLKHGAATMPTMIQVMESISPIQAHHQEILDFLSRLCAYAAKYGNLELLRDARSWDVVWDERCCDLAARHGHWDVLRYAHENGCPWSGAACAGAAKRGDLEMLRWLLDKGCPLTEACCNSAATHGLQTLMTCHKEFNAPIVKSKVNTPRLFDLPIVRAAKHGHLDAVQWLYDIITSPIATLLTVAAQHNHWHIVRWLHSQGWSAAGCDLAVYAVYHHNIEALEWLLDNGDAQNRLDVSSSWQYVLQSGDVEILELLFQRAVLISRSEREQEHLYTSDPAILQVLRRWPLLSI